MTAASSAVKNSEQFNPISTLISQKLDTARQQSPHHFRKPIIVLLPADGRKANQWVERLQQANVSGSGERIALIPYFTQQDYWVGIILRFNVAGQLQRAEYFDPVVNSSFDPTEFQKQFSGTYPDSTLLSKPRKQHSDPELSAKLTIDNLVTAAEEAYSIEHGKADRSQFPIDPGNDREHLRTIHHPELEASYSPQTNSLTSLETLSGEPSETKHTSLSTTSEAGSLSSFQEHATPSELFRESDSNSTTCPDVSNEQYLSLKTELESRLVDQSISNLSELQQLIEDKKHEIETLVSAGRHGPAQKRRATLSQLEEIQVLAERVKALEPQPVTGNVSTEEYLSLKAQLEIRLAEQGISDVVELEKRIEDKKQEIETLVAAGRHGHARRRKDSLSQLEHIQTLAQRLRVLEPTTVAEDVSEVQYTTLKTELDSRLAEHGISDEQELEKRIEEKKQEIESLERAGRHSHAQRRKDSLSQLEEIRMLAEKTMALAPKQVTQNVSNEEYLVLKVALESRLAEYAIRNAIELKEQMEQKKREIRSLESSGRHRHAQRRRDSLSQLEEIWILAKRVEALTPKALDNESWRMNADRDHSPSAVEILPNRILEDLIKTNSVSDIFEDFKTLPICSEKHVLALLFYTSVKLTPTARLSEYRMELPDSIDEKMMNEIESLEQRLKVEELHIVRIQTALDSCKIQFENQNWQLALQELRRIWKHVSPLHIQELRRLLDKVENGAKSIKDKEIILLIGETGAGKSTTIHFLSGSKMIETTVNGMNHIAPTEIKNSDLRKVVTAPSTTSITRFISPVTINLRDIGSRSNTSIILCDSLLFEDTYGPEVDIANGIGMVKAIRGCRSIKPVVLVSYKSMGDRCTGIKDLAHTLVGLMPGIKDHMRSFSYLFTKFPLKERKAINATLKGIQDHLKEEEKSDISFTNILGDMIKKTRRGAKTIDPIRDDPLDVIEELIDSVAIQHPEEVFRFSISEKSKSSVQEQVRKDQLSVMLAAKRSDFPYIHYKLDQIRYLDDLLQQKYIKQIYQDVVASVCKHLTEQYHTATNSLERCLINQTTTSDDDIQQYQTLIKHAQDADALRTQHLGQDVVHNSAYLKYLDQLVQTLSDDLQARNIDDTIVKINLDKIKLLMLHFSHVKKIYDNALQLLTQKLRATVDQVRKSVLENHFDGTATHMRTLQGAIITLDGHLDRVTLEKTYVDQRDFFVDYLTRSVAKFDNIFSRKLDKTDIESLNSCLSMIESVARTFALHSHIPRETIHDIYECLVKQIIRYFNDKVSQMDKAIEQKIELFALEQLMSELDAIRTISGLETRTAQAYFTTLEKLIGYISKCREDVEKLLLDFIRQDKTDFRKLARSLTILQSAKWIEKYRSGIYSDIINDTHSLILEELELLRKSVMQTILDLDGFDKIKNVSQIIARMNEMKRLSRFFSDIDEPIDSVNRWFIKVTDDVFCILSNIFNEEKWRGQQYQTPEFNKAEKGLQYLSICKEVPILIEGSCRATLNNLEQFIRCFSTHVQNEMAKHFEKIKQHLVNSETNIVEEARNLATHLFEISEVEANCKIVFSYFINQKIVEEWRKNLSTYLNELQDEMELLSSTGRVEDLNAKLTTVKALSKVDGFMKHDTFIDLYKKYQNRFVGDTSEIYHNAVQAIKENDYDRLATQIVALRQSNAMGENFLRQAKQAIHFGLDALTEETKNKAVMLRRNIDNQEITAIVTNLRKLQRAKRLPKDFCDASCDIDRCIQEVSKLVVEKIKRYVQGIRALLAMNNFAEADKQIDSITSTRDLLMGYCADDVAEEVDELSKTRSDLILRATLEKYIKMDISEYSIYPPKDIFAKFEEVSNTNSNYNQACISIREAILTKMRGELAKARSLELPSTDNIHTKKFALAIQYLPQNMKQILKEELSYCQRDIEHAFQQSSDRLMSVLQSSDVKTIKVMMGGYNKPGSSRLYFNKCRDHVLTTLKNTTAKIQKCIRDKDISEALESMKLVHEYQLEFQDLIPEIKQLSLDTRKEIQKIFTETSLSFRNRFAENNTLLVTMNAAETVETSFLHLFAFIKFRSIYRDLPSLHEMLPDNFDDEMIILQKKMACYFNHCEQQYREAMKNLDISLLNTVLEVGDRWNSLISKIRISSSTQYIWDESSNALLRAITQLTVFERMIESVSSRMEKLRVELMQQKLDNDDTEGFSKHRDAFYRSLNAKYLVLSSAKELSKFNMSFDAIKAEQDCLASLEEKIQFFYTKAEKMFEQVIQDAKLNRNEWEEFNRAYNNLISFKKEMKTLRSDKFPPIESFEQKMEKKLAKWELIVMDTSSIDKSAKVLIDMKSVANNFPPFKTKVEQKINKVLMAVKSSMNNQTVFRKLGVLLNQDSTGIGQSIVAGHKTFQECSLSPPNEKTRKHGIDYVLENLRGDHCNTNKLRKRYDEFRTIYETLTKQFLKPNLELDPLIAATKAIAGDIKQQSGQIEWDATIRNIVPPLAAYVFALWTLQSARHYFEAVQEENRTSYLLQPHAAQVISIFRMLGIGDDKEELKNNLVQIGTGEGKSVTLGATATILALLGFDVSCAYYTQYLSDRDYRSFLPLFISLDVVSHIRYGTFNKLCEYIINDDGDIRHVVEQLISKDINQAVDKAKHTKRAKILLIDEVDVLFSRDFYGNIYTPSTSLRDPTITALVNHIWAQKKSKLSLKKIQETQEYKNCCARFPKWEALIQEAIKDMIADVASFESHSYVVKDDKIGYIEQDNIIFNVFYGYKTLFPYYLEHERGKISKQSLDERASITIKCGGYSYAETPLQFQYIMGVTGTLETLTEPEKTVIENVYRINKQTITPSVFGKNNLQFTEKDDIKTENSADYYNVIRREIDDRLRGKSDRRAVLVFLESEKKLRDFYMSEEMKSIKDSVAILTEEASSAERETIIKRAIGSGQVTLFTKTFGRGTDFICHDPSVAANGGIHVIQTFLSEEVSEEVQIKGRTARQGDYGSYSMILLDKDLEKFQIESEDIQNVRDGKPLAARLLFKVTNTIGLTNKYDSVYDLLNDRRIDFFKAQYDANTQYVDVARKRHRIGQKFLHSLKSGDTEAVKQFLIGENKGSSDASRSRTICLMDATGSMSHLLQKSKNTVGVMFERAAEVLKENDIIADCFQLQFVVYRNYSSPEDKLLQHSTWETKPDNLRAFMNTIDVEGGWGNEAIEIGLWHANRENAREDITQVILIGDAPPNTKEEVTSKRQSKGENYWRTTKFAQPIYYEDELAKLTSKKISVHAFYVDQRAQQSFEDIAKRTGGRCEALDINSPSGSEMLTNLVTEEILRSVGGAERGEKLVNDYKAKFARSYTTS